ncbi:hypothetical protein GTA08_BOTSDO09538 [Botryosphaeria dothidea]|uniref:Rhodopsin domain-containing protein n=1 Tax=Botryosphaeria dothidea TaxID=55169 RepID=A0A8H4ILE5_9PEZI|nr:hypothetical protein GTA08_BOTSDO09538 [Botryosphaeria dothidea]
MYLITPKSTIALTVILTFIAALAVALRLLKRRKVDQLQRAVNAIVLGSHLDDLFCLVALVIIVAMSSMIVWGAAKGSIGAHSEELEGQRWITSVTPKWVILSKVVWVVLFLQPLALGFVKLSVVFFCRRLIVGRAFDIVSWTLVVTIACWMAVFFFGLFFDCGVEFAANWGSLSHIAARCPFGFMPTIIYTILDSVLDLAVLILPLPWIIKLRTPWTRKLYLCSCFMLGAFATAAAFVRMAFFIEAGIPAGLHVLLSPP